MIRRRWYAGLLLALLAGCSSAPPIRYYTLSANAAQTAVTAVPAYTVAVGPATVPQAVDRPQLVIRVGAHRVALADGQRWAEPLSDELVQVITDNLARELTGARLATWRQDAALNPDVRVLIDVRRFESTLGDAALIDALWTVRPRHGEPRSGHAVVREPVHGNGYDALVAAHSRALLALSRDIARTVRAAAPAAR